MIDENIPAAEDATAELVRQIVVEQMAELPDEDREILAGKYLLGLTYQELADSLGLKEGTIRVRCFRAKERLREVLDRAGVDLPRNGRQTGAKADPIRQDRR